MIKGTSIGSYVETHVQIMNSSHFQVCVDLPLDLANGVASRFILRHLQTGHTWLPGTKDEGTSPD